MLKINQKKMKQEDDYEVKLKKLMDSALIKGVERGSISISQCVEILKVENVEDAKKIIIKLLKLKEDGYRNRI